MDLTALRHQSDSRYCFSVGPHKVLVRLAIARKVHATAIRLIYGISHEFVRRRKSVPMVLKFFDGTFDYYEAYMEADPTRFLYFFEIEQGGETWCYSESGLYRGFDYDVAFISAFQMIGENRSDFVLPKPSWEGRLFYQIFPERFAKGLPNKDYVTQKWDAKGKKLGNNAFLGGDLQGVLNHLEYLASLGVGAIYLNPIHPSPSNHKYDVLDYFDVDPHFGGMEAFDALVKRAHELDIKIVMDLVFNHTSVNHPFFQDVILKGRESKYYSWYFIDGEYPDISKKNYATFAMAKYMPKLDTSNPEVQDYLVEVGSFWMKEHHVDGFRLDVCEGVSHEFWTRFKLSLKKIDPEVLLIGEIWLNSESYLGPNQIDGVMNYPLLGVVSGYCLGHESAEDTAAKCSGLLMRYKLGNVAMMLNLLSSHDIQRFYHLCHGDPDCVLIGYGLLMFYLGFPCLYYGDEIFTDGEGDPDCRRGMDWDSPIFKSERHRVIVSLLRLRRQFACMRSGHIAISAEIGLLVISRFTDTGEKLTYYANMTDTPIKMAGNVHLSYRYEKGFILPRGFLISK